MPRALDLGPRQRGPPYKKGNGRAGGLIPSRARPSRHCRWSAAAAAAHATARSAAARTPPPRACPPPPRRPPPRTPHREEPTGGGGPKRSGRRRRSSAVPLRRSNNRGRGEARPPASAGAGNRNPSPRPLPSAAPEVTSGAHLLALRTAGCRQYGARRLPACLAAQTQRVHVRAQNL